MKLKPIQRLAVRVPGRADSDLAPHTAYYRETTGQTIELWALVVQVLQQLMDTDRDFQAGRRRTQNGPGAGSKSG